MSRRLTRSLRPRSARIAALEDTIPTILKRKRTSRVRQQLEEASVQSDSVDSEKMSRKRKCPLPKNIDSDDGRDRIEIITIRDSSEDDMRSMDRVSAKSVNCRQTTATKSRSQNLSKHFHSLSIDLLTPIQQHHHSSRYSPLPNLSWADAKEVWDLMVNKDDVYQRNALMLHRHPTLQARMRSILMDWLSEVCEVYHLNRDTYYLCVDLIDRYLSFQTDVPKQQLQLLGITCLFIAAKIEEIYPPKMSEFAYVTDGACNEPEITCKELVILKALNWDLCPITANNWLTVFMQLYATHEKENSLRRDGDAFLIPEYQSHLFAQIAHLVDLCVLDIGSLAYSYSVIAASALFHFTNEEIVYQCTGIHMNELRECVIWMIPFALAIKDEGFDNPKLKQKVSEDSQPSHNIQSHTVDLQLLEKAHIKQCQQEVEHSDSEQSFQSISSPIATRSAAILTPPKSNSKH